MAPVSVDYFDQCYDMTTGASYGSGGENACSKCYECEATPRAKKVVLRLFLLFLQ